MCWVELRPWHHWSRRYYCRGQQPSVLIWKHTKALRADLTISPHYGLTCYLATCLRIRKTCLWQISAGRHIAGSEADKQELCLKHILLLFYIKPLQVRKKNLLRGPTFPVRKLSNLMLESHRLNVWTSGEIHIYLSTNYMLNTVC